MNHPEVTAQALALLRNGESFQWYVIPLLACVVYIPFFVVSMYCYDWRPKIQKTVIGSLALTNAAMLVVFGAALGWI